MADHSRTHEVFVLGDLAAIETDGLFPASHRRPCKWDGTRLATRCAASAASHSYHSAIATAAHWPWWGAAVGVLFGRWKIQSVLAWLPWLAVHLLFLRGLRNQGAVLLSWLYYLFTHKRPNRLITDSDRKISRLPEWVGERRQW